MLNKKKMFSAESSAGNGLVDIHNPVPNAHPKGRASGRQSPSEGGRSSTMLKHTIMFAAVAGLVFALGATASADIISNLIAHYEFETTAGDDSQNNHEATARDGATIDTSGSGLRSSVLDLTADLDAALGSLNIPIGSTWTIATWFNTPAPDVGNYRVLVSGGGDNEWIVTNGDQLGLYVGGDIGSGYYFNGSPDTTTGWHHLAAVANGSTTQFYIDGSAVGSAVAAVMSLNVDTLGNSWATGDAHTRFADYLDDIRIYTRALTGSEVADIYSIPEPASAVLLLVGLPFVMRRKRR